MSPAGYWPQLRAAIEAGADAVYFGLKHFTARAKVGFELAELPEVMRTLHQRGVKGFVTFNTLIFEEELDEAAKTLAGIATGGADAIIVQDVGALKMARAIAPDLELHASTQMSISDAAGVEFARSLGAARVTLARELSLKEIADIRRTTDCDLEIFVHGALCVAYSGQCFSSEAWGGRSANRGQCAQACRLPYELVVDDTVKPLDDARYLLSPGDLCTVEHVPAMVEMGIAALKIEGRYKDAEYVALVTRAYREAVDAASAGVASSLTPKDRLQLEQVYSRGLGAHFLTGTNHQEVVKGRAPRHRGVLAGKVTRVLPNAVEVEAEHELSAFAPLKPGDGLVFDAADWRSPQEAEEGGRLYEVAAAGGGRLELRFGNGAVNFARVRIGDLVWRTHDADLDKAAAPYLNATAPLRRQPVDVRVTARVGEPLRIEWRVGAVSCETVAKDQLVGAQSQGLTAEFLREQLGRLGNTSYALAGVELCIEGKPFAPPSLLNQLRRDAVARLQELQGQHMHTVRSLDWRPERPKPAASGPLSLHLLVRTAEQLDAALEFRPASITLDYLDLYGLKPSVERVKAAGIGVRVASPRILKPGEERIVDFLKRLDVPLLVRSSGLLTMLDGRADLTGDFSLNAANSLSAREMLGRGLQRITPTHDLNAAQIAELAREVGGGVIEAIAYQHLPVFHTEHCVFCRFLSSGTSYKDCGRPCEKHTVSLRDLNGRAHPLVADVGCRNTVFGAEAQEASGHLEEWFRAGIPHFRLEFAHESAQEVRSITNAFDATLRGEKTAVQLTQELKRLAPQGTTLGSLFVPLAELTGARK